MNGTRNVSPAQEWALASIMGAHDTRARLLYWLCVEGNATSDERGAWLALPGRLRTAISERFEPEVRS